MNSEKETPKTYRDPASLSSANSQARDGDRKDKMVPPEDSRKAPGTEKSPFDKRAQSSVPSVERDQKTVDSERHPEEQNIAHKDYMKKEDKFSNSKTDRV